MPLYDQRHVNLCTTFDNTDFSSMQYLTDIVFPYMRKEIDFIENLLILDLNENQLQVIRRDLAILNESYIKGIKRMSSSPCHDEFFAFLKTL